MSKCRDLIHAQSFILYIYISYKRINNIGDKLLWLYMFLTIDQSPNLFASLFLFYVFKRNFNYNINIPQLYDNNLVYWL